MKHNFRIPLIISFALVILIATSAFTTASGHDDKVVFGGSYVLEEGETLTGNLIILGGEVTLEKGTTVKGDTALVGGSLDASGVIENNLVIIGGTAYLNTNAVVNRNVTMIGGNLTRATGSQIKGEIENFAGGPFSLTIPGVPITPTTPVLPFYPSPISFMWKMIYFIGMVVFTAALAMLIALLWARPTQRVANAIRINPVGTGGFGCLTLIVAPGLLLLVAITIILSPLSLLGLLLIAAAVLFGWAAINLEVGNRLARLFKATWSAPIAAGMGALIFNLVVFGLGMIPCLGAVLVSLVVLFALGGVLVTRFGTHDYPEVPAAMRYPEVVKPSVPAAPYVSEVVKPSTAQIKSPAAVKTASKKTNDNVKTPAKPVTTSKAKSATVKSKPAAKAAPKKPARTTKSK